MHTCEMFIHLEVEYAESQRLIPCLVHGTLEQRIKRKIIIGFARSAIKSLQVGRSLVIVI